MILRVFPRRTKATPRDDYAVVGDPQLFTPTDIDEVHISVAFTWDLPEAERLAYVWGRIAPVKMGGPALGTRGEAFVGGKYIREGYTITSRGCPNKCWFCTVCRRDGHVVRELPIVDGWNILDDNILACSESHIRAVFAMLKKQDEKAEFTGGLEAKRLKPWHVELIRDLEPRQIFFAYDTPDDWEPLIEASRIMGEGGCLNRHLCRCYVLIGFPGDTFNKAEERLKQVVGLGMFPMAMLYRDYGGKTDSEWRGFQRLWARPALIYIRHKGVTV